LTQPSAEIRRIPESFARKRRPPRGSSPHGGGVLASPHWGLRPPGFGGSPPKRLKKAFGPTSSFFLYFGTSLTHVTAVPKQLTSSVPMQESTIVQQKHAIWAVWPPKGAEEKKPGFDLVCFEAC
jgi:hypothetical protein